MPWSTLRVRPADLLLSVGLALFTVLGTIGAARDQPETRDLDVLGVALLLVGPVLLLARRQRPVEVLFAAQAAALAYWTIGYPHGPVFLALMVAVVNAMLEGHRREAWAALGIGWIAFPWLPVAFGEDAPEWGAVLVLGAWLLVLGTTTEVVRARRERAAEAAHADEEARRRRASDERLRMAQELHDVLAHDLSLISVQAGVALHLLDERPEQTRPALVAIKEASGDALGELRRVLDLLRTDGDEGAAVRAPRQPAPTLADLEGLVSRSAAAGVDATFAVEGVRRPLPGEVERAAYRIVQESLTNATRYAGGAPVRIAVAFGAEDLTVQVDDDGPGPAPGRSSGSGSGIAGMRERTTALGGRLDAGPRAGGGFRVRAWIPVAPVTAEPQP